MRGILEDLSHSIDGFNWALLTSAEGLTVMSIGEMGESFNTMKASGLFALLSAASEATEEISELGGLAWGALNFENGRIYFSRCGDSYILVISTGLATSPNVIQALFLKSIHQIATVAN